MEDCGFFIALFTDSTLFDVKVSKLGIWKMLSTIFTAHSLKPRERLYSSSFSCRISYSIFVQERVRFHAKLFSTFDLFFFFNFSIKSMKKTQYGMSSVVVRIAYVSLLSLSDITKDGDGLMWDSMDFRNQLQLSSFYINPIPSPMIYISSFAC